MLPVAFGVWCCFPKKFLIQPVAPLIEGVDGTVAHPMGCPTVPRGSFRHELKKKLFGFFLGGAVFVVLCCLFWFTVFPVL